MRFIRVTLAAVALAGAFVAGHITSAPPTAVDAQVPQFSHFRCYTSLFWKPASVSIPVQLHDQFSTETDRAAETSVLLHAGSEEASQTRYRIRSRARPII